MAVKMFHMASTALDSRWINSIRKQLAKDKRNTLGKIMLEFEQHVFQAAQLLRETQIISVQKHFFPTEEKSQR